MSKAAMEIAYGDRVFRCPYARFSPPTTPERRATLRRSIIRYGVDTPVLVDQDDNVVDGVQRLTICLEAGKRLDEVPIEVRTLTPEEGAALAKSMNAHRTPVAGERKPKQHKMPQVTRQEEVDQLIPLLVAGLSTNMAARVAGVSPRRASLARRYAVIHGLIPKMSREEITRHQRGQAAILRKLGYSDLADEEDRRLARPPVGWLRSTKGGKIRATGGFTVTLYSGDAARSLRILSRWSESGSGTRMLTPEWLRHVGQGLVDLANLLSNGG